MSVFGVGQGDGYHYYVMDLVDGQTLGEVVAGLSGSFSISQSSKNIQEDETRLAEVPWPPLEQSSDQHNQLDGFSVSSKNKNPQHSEKIEIRNSMPSAKTSAKHFRWAARIRANIADALSYAHQSNILHRDIKPSNIILDRKGVVWITDFGSVSYTHLTLPTIYSV